MKITKRELLLIMDAYSNNEEIDIEEISLEISRCVVTHFEKAFIECQSRLFSAIYDRCKIDSSFNMEYMNREIRFIVGGDRIIYFIDFSNNTCYNSEIGNSPLDTITQLLYIATDSEWDFETYADLKECLEEESHDLEDIIDKMNDFISAIACND